MVAAPGVSVVAAESADPLHLALVRRRFTRRDQNVELQRFVALRLELDLVRAGVDAELLEGAIEAIDISDEIAVDVDLSLTRLDLELQRAFVAWIMAVTAAAAATGGRVAVPVP